MILRRDANQAQGLLPIATAFGCEVTLLKNKYQTANYFILLTYSTSNK
jgi:hypothetical protein